MSYVTRPQPSTTYQLIEARLDGTLAQFIAARWPRKSWRVIADEIREQTGVSVSYQTLRGWFAGRITIETRVA